MLWERSRLFAAAVICVMQGGLKNLLSLGHENYCSCGKKPAAALSDWQQAYEIIKKARNYYSEEAIETELFERMNERARRELGLNIWTHKDIVEIVKQLKDSGRIELDNFLWKGRLRIKKSMN